MVLTAALHNVPFSSAARSPVAYVKYIRDAFLSGNLRQAAKAALFGRNQIDNNDKECDPLLEEP